MNYPSIKTIMSLSVSKDVAKYIRSIMEGLGTGQERMERINDVLCSYGVEYICHGHNSKSPSIYYCNMRDPYSTTVLYIKGRFSIGCWGNIVERGHYD